MSSRISASESRSQRQSRHPWAPEKPWNKRASCKSEDNWTMIKEMKISNFKYWMKSKRSIRSRRWRAQCARPCTHTMHQQRHRLCRRVPRPARCGNLNSSWRRVSWHSTGKYGTCRSTLKGCTMSKLNYHSIIGDRPSNRKGPKKSYEKSRAKAEAGRATSLGTRSSPRNT